MSDIRFSFTDESRTFSEESFRSAVRANVPALVTAQKGEDRYRISLGWHDVDEWAGEKWLSRYEELAAKVRKDADALVVIGIGGSNQAARAVYEALGGKSVIGHDHNFRLRAGRMLSPDIRAGIAMLLAAMSAKGTSVIGNIDQIDRGYEDIDIRLNTLGAAITRI